VPDAPVTTTLTSITPFFIVRDVLASIAFYRDQLGFDLAVLIPDDDPYFAILRRDTVQVMLKAILPDVLPMPNSARHPWARWDAFIHTDDPDALSREFLRRGVTLRTALGVDGDNLLGFEVADHDGYVLFFGRPA
jgi:catechol 2,3-dioxygenase-like lactoylglutathione lyase family enzyme